MCKKTLTLWDNRTPEVRFGRAFVRQRRPCIRRRRRAYTAAAAACSRTRETPSRAAYTRVTRRPGAADPSGGDGGHGKRGRRCRRLGWWWGEGGLVVIQGGRGVTGTHARLTYTRGSGGGGDGTFLVRLTDAPTAERKGGKTVTQTARARPTGARSGC